MKVTFDNLKERALNPKANQTRHTPILVLNRMINKFDFMYAESTVDTNTFLYFVVVQKWWDKDLLEVLSSLQSKLGNPELMPQLAGDRRLQPTVINMLDNEDRHIATQLCFTCFYSVDEINKLLAAVGEVVGEYLVHTLNRYKNQLSDANWRGSPDRMGS